MGVVSTLDWQMGSTSIAANMDESIRSRFAETSLSPAGIRCRIQALVLFVVGPLLGQEAALQQALGTAWAALIARKLWRKGSAALNADVHPATKTSKCRTWAGFPSRFCGLIGTAGTIIAGFTTAQGFSYELAFQIEAVHVLACERRGRSADRC